MFKKYKPFLKPFLIIFAFYCVSMLAIWRSGVSFIDDNGRAFTGKGWTSDFNRYSSSILSFFLIQLNTSLVDISPWSQIVAMAFLTAASLLIVYYFGDVKKKNTFNTFFAGWPDAVHLGLLALQIRRAMHGDGFAN